MSPAKRFMMSSSNEVAAVSELLVKKKKKKKSFRKLFTAHQHTTTGSVLESVSEPGSSQEGRDVNTSGSVSFKRRLSP